LGDEQPLIPEPKPQPTQAAEHPTVESRSQRAIYISYASLAVAALAGLFTFLQWRAADKQVAIAQKQFTMTSLLEYQKMLNDDNATMPNLTLGLAPQPTDPTAAAYVFLSISNDGNGDASDVMLRNTATNKNHFTGFMVRAHASPVTIRIPRNTWIDGQPLSLLYVSPHGSLLQQTLVFNGNSYKPSPLSIARPYQFLIQNGVISAVTRVDKSNPTVLFGIGPPPGAKEP
jgi:hypothetical protein